MQERGSRVRGEYAFLLKKCIIHVNVLSQKKQRRQEAISRGATHTFSADPE